MIFLIFFLDRRVYENIIKHSKMLRQSTSRGASLQNKGSLMMTMHWFTTSTEHFSCFHVSWCFHQHGIMKNANMLRQSMSRGAPRLRKPPHFVRPFRPILSRGSTRDVRKAFKTSVAGRPGSCVTQSIFLIEVKIVCRRSISFNFSVQMHWRYWQFNSIFEVRTY